MMSHREFSDLRTHRMSEDRDKTMHLTIQAKPFQRIFSISFEGAPIIMQVDTCCPGNQPVGEVGWNGTCQTIIFAILAPATYQIIASSSFSRSMGMSAGSFCMSA